MPEDTIWPIECPCCKHEFAEEIQRLKDNAVVRCPLCHSNLDYRSQEFAAAMDQRTADGRPGIRRHLFRIRSSN
jgi:hypothetical protein